MNRCTVACFVLAVMFLFYGFPLVYSQTAPIYVFEVHIKQKNLSKSDNNGKEVLTESFSKSRMYVSLVGNHIFKLDSIYELVFKLSEVGTNRSTEVPFHNFFLDKVSKSVIDVSKKVVYDLRFEKFILLNFADINLTWKNPGKYVTFLNNKVTIKHSPNSKIIYPLIYVIDPSINPLQIIANGLEINFKKVMTGNLTENFPIKEIYDKFNAMPPSINDTFNVKNYFLVNTYKSMFYNEKKR